MIKYFLRILKDDIEEREAFLRSAPLDPRADRVERVLHRRLHTYARLKTFHDKQATRKENAK